MSQLHFVCLNLGEKIEQFSWSTFISPFHWTLWLGLFGLSVSASITLWLFHIYLPNGQDKFSLLYAFCITFSSIFGLGIKDANDVNLSSSARLSLFTVFLSGSLFFYTYGAFLTSSLAVPNEQFPFNSPEGILNTKYRYFKNLRRHCKTNIVCRKIVYHGKKVFNSLMFL